MKNPIEFIQEVKQEAFKFLHLEGDFKKINGFLMALVMSLFFTFRSSFKVFRIIIMSI